MLRNIFVLYRKPGMTMEEFRRHWIEVHPPLVNKIPGLIDFVQNYPLAGGDGGEPKCDGIGWISFEDQAAMEAGLASPEGQDALAYLPEFLDLERTYSIVTEVHEQL